MSNESKTLKSLLETHMTEKTIFSFNEEGGGPRFTVNPDAGTFLVTEVGEGYVRMEGGHPDKHVFIFPFGSFHMLVKVIPGKPVTKTQCDH